MFIYYNFCNYPLPFSNKLLCGVVFLHDNTFICPIKLVLKMRFQ